MGLGFTSVRFSQNLVRLCRGAWGADGRLVDTDPVLSASIAREVRGDDGSAHEAGGGAHRGHQHVLEHVCSRAACQLPPASTHKDAEASRSTSKRRAHYSITTALDAKKQSSTRAEVVLFLFSFLSALLLSLKLTAIPSGKLCHLRVETHRHVGTTRRQAIMEKRCGGEQLD